MGKPMAALAAASLTAVLAATQVVPASAVADCSVPTEIVSSTVSPKKVVLGVAQPKGIVITVRIRSNGCTVDRVQFGLYGPNFIDDVDLEPVGTTNGVTTYDKGLRITPGNVPNAEAGLWKTFVSVWGQEFPNAPGPNFQMLRAARLTSNATPEPVRKGKTITVRGQLDRADWDALAYRGYGGREVQLQWRSPKGTYRTVKTVTSAKSGSVTATVKAARDGCFRFAFKGSTTTAAASSAGDCVDVR